MRNLLLCRTLVMGHGEDRPTRPDGLIDSSTTIGSGRWDDPEPDTLKTCEACTGSGCVWCYAGLQSRLQADMWKVFRTRMRHISNTYSFLEEIVLDVIARLSRIDSDQALVLVLEGQRLLERWLRARHEDGGRHAITEDLKAFMKRGLDFLAKREP